MQVLSSLKTVKARHPDCKIVRVGAGCMLFVNPIHVLRQFKGRKRNADTNSKTRSL